MFGGKKAHCKHMIALLFFISLELVTFGFLLVFIILPMQSVEYQDAEWFNHSIESSIHRFSIYIYIYIYQCRR